MKVSVSVIVAAYNAEKYLRQCLDSICGQTLRDIEIICVNDGSSDETANILTEYAAIDSRIRVFTKDNEGLGGASARNFGLEQAQGKYVSILDSDDFFELSMLEKTFAKAEDTTADIVVFGGYEYDDVSGVSYPSGSILNENALPDKDIFSFRDCPSSIFQISAGMAWNKLYRRSFLVRYGIQFQRIKYTDDAYFTFAHMILAKRITALREKFCYYRVNSGINQTAGLSDYPDSSYRPYIELKKFLDTWRCYSIVEQSMLNCAVAFMRYFYDKIDRFDSFQYLHEKLRTEIFLWLGINTKPKSYFYHERSYLWCRQVLEYSAGEISFLAARAYGGDCTTGVLRFRFPYSLIPKGSKVVLLGARVMAQHYYAQMVMGSHCAVVSCVAQENPLGLSYVQSMNTLERLVYDYILIAYAEDWLVNPALEYLKEIGVPNEKIILGGNIT